MKINLRTLETFREPPKPLYTSHREARDELTVNPRAKELTGGRRQAALAATPAASVDLRLVAEARSLALALVSVAREFSLAD